MHSTSRIDHVSPGKRLAVSFENSPGTAPSGGHGAPWGRLPASPARAPRPCLAVTVGTRGDTRPRQVEQAGQRPGPARPLDVNAASDGGPVGRAPAPSPSDSRWWCLVPQRPVTRLAVRPGIRE